MNALTTGALIILVVLVGNAASTYITQQIEPTIVVSGCSSEDNLTACDSIARQAFIDSFLDVTFNGLPNCPDWFNDFWVGIGVFLLTLGVILCVSYFIGLIFGGAG